VGDRHLKFYEPRDNLRSNLVVRRTLTTGDLLTELGFGLDRGRPGAN
jgi:hypothetical protein